MKRVETKAENNRAQQGAIPGTGSNGWERKGSGRGGGEEEEPPRPNHRLISWGSMTALCTRRPDSSAAASIAAASARSEPWCGGCPGCGQRGCDIRPRCPQVALSRGVETAAPAAVTTTGRASTDRNEWRKREGSRGTRPRGRLGPRSSNKWVLLLPPRLAVCSFWEGMAEARTVWHYKLFILFRSSSINSIKDELSSCNIMMIYQLITQNIHFHTMY
jgi:hypothetical protein